MFLHHDPSFEELFGSLFQDRTSVNHSTKEGVDIAIDVPGVKPDDIQVTVSNRVLSVQWTRGKVPGRKEYRLGENLDEGSITAQLAHGVLSIKVKKVETSPSRKIPVTTSN